MPTKLTQRAVHFSSDDPAWRDLMILANCVTFFLCLHRRNEGNYDHNKNKSKSKLSHYQYLSYSLGCSDYARERRGRSFLTAHAVADIDMQPSRPESVLSPSSLLQLSPVPPGPLSPVPPAPLSSVPPAPLSPPLFELPPDGLPLVAAYPRRRLLWRAPLC